MEIHMEMTESIAIIGAGIAGLSAAQKLYENGFNDITIFEALDRIGGQNGLLELGAQWLHGQTGNPLYHLAKEVDLISNPNLDFGIEGTGIFCTDSGKMLKTEDITQIVFNLFKIRDELSETPKIEGLVSVLNVYKNKFQEFIESEKCPPIDRNMLWPLFQWFIKFEEIDNSCDDLKDVSLLSYTEYEECDGIGLINFKNGYQTAIDVLSENIPKNFFRMETAVKQIEFCDKTSRIKLFIENKNQIKSVKTFDHIIITSSLGYIKNNFNSFLGSILSPLKIDIINALGFGTIDKIYLYFENPFWEKDFKGLQLIWTEHNHNLPDWVYDISGFDPVRQQPNMLMAWIGGKGAQQMEIIESDQMVGTICANLLRLFLPKLTIDMPSKVIRSKWGTNPYICGAYSNRSLEYESLNCEIHTLYEPVFKNKYFNCVNKSIDCPLVLFAGEATDREYYSTTHGAMRSGHREAQRLVNFYQTLKPKYKL